MLVYRVVNVKYKADTLSGVGAENFGGRWNQVGTRAVYCSENISLALLEYYVHSENISNLPQAILIAKIYIPDEFQIIPLTALPADWNAYPYTSKTTAIFSEYAKNSDFFALKVPSTIVGLEFNYILNPLFKEFGKVEILAFIALPIDDRLKSAERK